MSTSPRRKFLKASAALGSFLGLSTLGIKSRADESLRLLSDPFFPEPPPKINRGPAFLRATVARSRPTGKIPVLQGATSQTETQFRILIRTNRVYRYYVIDSSGVKRQVSPRARQGTSTSQSVVDHVFVDGLKPGATYALEIETTGLGQSSERRVFSTMAAPLDGRAPLRVALLSCLNDRYVDDQAGMWAAVAKSLPELMIFNGDSCYVDQRANGTVEGMWDRHVTTRRMLDVFKWDRLVPILTTWDDHDTGENDSNSSNPFMNVAREYFTAMFGSDPVTGYAAQPAGTSYTYDTHAMRFILLDGRSNRNAMQTFSSDDERWLETQIAKSPGPIWLVNGMQFFGAYLMGAESVEYTSREQLDRIMGMGSRAESPMVLMSGDVHFSEIMEIGPEQMGYKTYELTSSALHSRTFPGIQFRSHNERRIESTSRYNFMAIEMKAPSKKTVEFEVVCMGAGESEFFRLKAEVSRSKRV